MRFTVIALSLVATLVSATVLPKREVWQSPFAGEIVIPISNGTIISNGNFAFQYTPSQWCESAFEPFTVYLTQGATPPPFSNVSEGGTLAAGSYVYKFGKFVVSRFGLPLPTGSVPPPASLNLPKQAVDALEKNIQPYLAVLQEFTSCPGHIATEYSLTSIPIKVAGTA